MMGESQKVDYDDELKRLTLKNGILDNELKSLDIKLKNLEIENKPGFWKGVFTNAAFLAAVITIFVTSGTAFVSFIVAKQQQEVDAAKSQDNIIVGSLLAKSFDEKPCLTATQLTYYLTAGIFTGQRYKAMSDLVLILNYQGNCGLTWPRISVPLPLEYQLKQK
jgi:hypothetical protein